MQDNDKSVSGMDRTSEPTEVAWVGGAGKTQSVRVKPYAGTVVVNGREFELSVLCSDDIPERMYRDVDTESNHEDA